MPFIKDGVGYIPLQVSKTHKRWFALVDVEDYGRVSGHKWYGRRSGRTIYVQATNDTFLAAHQSSLHAYVLSVEPGTRIDHINGNGLDNRRANLRIASAKENTRNSLKTDSRFVTSKFKGVLLTSSGRWAASITVDGRHITLGMFDSEAEAAVAYDAAAVEHFGDFAKTNTDMGLFESPTPIRNEAGIGQPNGAKFVGRNTMLGRPDTPTEPWDYEGFNPDRATGLRVVGVARHRRTRRLLYRLSTGQLIPPEHHMGPHPSASELKAMRSEMGKR